MKSIFEKIKQKIQKKESKHILYYVSVAILVCFFLFVFITTIIQTNMVGIEIINAPILIWIISQPYVGVFFIPFMIIISYICWFIISVGKPVTIDHVKSSCLVLFENGEINKDDYENLYKILDDASRKKLEMIKQKQDEINELIKQQEILASQIEKENINEKQEEEKETE